MPKPASAGRRPGECTDLKMIAVLVGPRTIRFRRPISRERSERINLRKRLIRRAPFIRVDQRKTQILPGALRRGPPSLPPNPDREKSRSAGPAAAPEGPAAVAVQSRSRA